MIGRPDDADDVLGDEPQKIPEYSTPEVILADEPEEEFEPFTLLMPVHGRGKQVATLQGNAEGNLILRIDDVLYADRWSEVSLPFSVVRQLLDWWESGAWTGRTLSDLGTKDS